MAFIYVNIDMQYNCCLAIYNYLNKTGDVFSLRGRYMKYIVYKIYEVYCI